MKANKEDAVNLSSWGFYLLVAAVLALIGWGFFQITLNAEIHVDNTNASYRNYEKLADMIAGADRLPNNDSRSNFTSLTYSRLMRLLKKYCLKLSICLL